MSVFSYFTEKKRKRYASLLATFFVATMVAFPLGNPPRAEAAVSSWAKGGVIIPTSVDDFGTEAMKRSLDSLRATGANYVGLLYPIYQSNIYSTDIARGWNTPSDASLAEATRYAHSIGLQVMYKVHHESYGGEWRANIDPWNRQEWHDRNKALMLNLARVAKENNVEMISIGTEMVRLTSTAWNSSNTGYWRNLISAMRGVYSGKLTYGANSTYNQTDQYTNEKIYVDFWGDLDYVSLSPYYNLDYGSNSVESLMRAWDYWNQYDIKPFADRVGKPILFGEIGYRSVNDAYKDPWNWGRGGWSDQTTQANAYDALMSYWNNHSYMQGVFWWNWSSNESQVSAGDTNYSPERKLAEGVLKKWFGGTPPAPVATNPVFTGSSAASPHAVTTGQPIALSLSLTNNGGTLSNALVDLEVYKDTGEAMFQKTFTGETLGANQTKTYQVSWTPTSPGSYVIRGGVFSSDWTRNYYWLDRGEIMTAASPSSSGGSSGSGTSTATSTTGTPTSQPTGNGTIHVWWPTPDVHVSGTQPFKAMLEAVDPANYWMTWRVDGDRENDMWHSDADYPHKEGLVDLTGWTWKQGGPYNLTFTAKDSRGSAYATKSLNIYVDR